MKNIATFETYAGEKGSARYPKRMRKLQYAKGLEQKGIDYEVIRCISGWYKNPFDEMWRYEINDQQLRYNDIYFRDVKKQSMIMRKPSNSMIFSPFSVPLDKFVDDRSTTLFKEYPELREWQVWFVDIDDEYTRVSGVAEYETKIIKFYKVKYNFDKLTWWSYSDDLNDHQKKVMAKEMEEPLFQLTNDIKETCVHEIQHAIQYSEGFGLGSNTDMFSTKTIRLEEEQTKLKQYYYNRYPQLKDAVENLQDLKGLDLTAEEINAHPLVKAYEEAARKADGFPYAFKTLNTKHRDKFQHVSAYDQYHDTAGEIESRDVQQRMNYPKKTAYIVFNSIKHSTPKSADDPNVLGVFNSYFEAEDAIPDLAKKMRVHPDDLYATWIESRTMREPYTLDYHNKSRVNVIKKPSE